MTLNSGIDRDDGDNVWLPRPIWPLEEQNEGRAYNGESKDLGGVEYEQMGILAPRLLWLIMEE